MGGYCISEMRKRTDISGPKGNVIIITGHSLQNEEQPDIAKRNLWPD